MDDREILQRINALVAEEHGLTNAHREGPLSEADKQRMQDLEVTLDQCWDLLRQRRARRHAGQDPGEAEVRPPSVVENYKQ
jgi:hypothetical protein